jgi:hypothetical protein
MGIPSSRVAHGALPWFRFATSPPMLKGLSPPRKREREVQGNTADMEPSRGYRGIGLARTSAVHWPSPGVESAMGL